MTPTQEHLEFLIRTFQKRNNLTPDGLYGPKTAAKIEYYLELDRPKLTGLAAVWESALKDLGKGGDPGTNNVSAYIQNLRRECGFPTTEKDATNGFFMPADGPWCAVGISAHLLRCGIPIKSRGAYGLVETMVAHGQGYECLDGLGNEDDSMKLDGVYLAVWKRKGWDSKGSAHVRLIKPNLGHVEYIEFNGKGDKVRQQAMTWLEMRTDLLMIAGWKA